MSSSAYHTQLSLEESARAAGHVKGEDMQMKDECLSTVPLQHLSIRYTGDVASDVVCPHIRCTGGGAADVLASCMGILKFAWGSVTAISAGVKLGPFCLATGLSGVIGANNTYGGVRGGVISF